MNEIRYKLGEGPTALDGVVIPPKAISAVRGYVACMGELPFGVFHASGDTYTQTYKCWGCTAEAVARHDGWEINFKHSADCGAVAFCKALNIVEEETTRQI